MSTRLAAAPERELTSVNPATGDVFAHTRVTDPDRIDAVVEAAHCSEWSSLSAAERSRYLLELARQVSARSTELARLEHLDTGKPLKDALEIDMANVVRWLTYAAGWPKRIEGRVLPVDGEQFAYTLREPLGVVAAITPWNYPLMIAVWKIAPALAAGCPVVIKPSERAFQTVLRFVEIANTVLPERTLSIVIGDGAAAEKLIGAPHVEKVSFTGSVHTGKHVAIRSAALGIPCTTELGGKSAAILLPGLSGEAMSEACADIVAGLIHNAGQACNAPGRILFPLEREEEVAAAFVAAMTEVNPRDFGPLIDSVATHNVQGFVDQALLQGSRPMAVSQPGKAEGNYFPAMILRTFQTSVIARCEVFGPVSAALAYDDPTAIAPLANSVEYDLAAGLYGPWEEAMKMARSLRAGHIYINGWSVQDPCAPFGGMGRSGIGREHGAEGLDAFLRTKTVYAA